MASFNQKLSISLGSAALFALVNLPYTYKLTSNVTSLNLFNVNTGCPTSLGLLVHSLVFFAFSYLSMQTTSVSTGIKIKHSLYGALIFFFLSSPTMFKFVSSIFGNGIANSSGCPTLTGILVHATVYCVALIAVMYLPEGNK